MGPTLGKRLGQGWEQLQSEVEKPPQVKGSPRQVHLSIPGGLLGRGGVQGKTRTGKCRSCDHRGWLPGLPAARHSWHPWGGKLVTVVTQEFPSFLDLSLPFPTPTVHCYVL